ncbi:hypothetical protein [Streptomyces sp. KL116D]|uniref:hypothetical protein n=1 Tax=Streptomyces sp. KL116D TaxID=3045152 RepID=UPI003556D2A3
MPPRPYLAVLARRRPAPDRLLGQHSPRARHPRDQAQHAPPPALYGPNKQQPQRTYRAWAQNPFSRIPAATRQAIVVTGDGADATTGTAQRYVRDATTGWQRLGTPWPTRNALKGWTAHHVQATCAPSGVFGLTDAGGHEPNPGTELAVRHGPGLRRARHQRRGRAAGRRLRLRRRHQLQPQARHHPPGLDPPAGHEPRRRHLVPRGPRRPHPGLRHSPKPRMRELLRWLDKESRPVVVMGDKTTLGR